MNELSGEIEPHYDIIIFDCDGVLLDSNNLKIDAFRRTLEIHGFAPDVVAAASLWQSQAFGTPRHRLFAEVLAGCFGRPPIGTDLHRLLADFGKMCASGYLSVEETPGLRGALSALVKRARLFIVSGSDETELRTVFQQRDLSSYFESIFGSPGSKIENIGRVKQSCLEAGWEAEGGFLFVGDAVADMEAAKATGCDFVFMAPFSTVKSKMLELAEAQGFQVIENVGDLIPLRGRG